jgi:hypothetical protein
MTPKNTMKKIRTLKKTSFSRPQLAIFILVFAAIGGYIIYRTFAAGPLVASLEAEQMSMTPGSGVITDTTASAGKAMLLSTNGTTTGTVNFPGSVTSLSISAKGTQCSGAPTMNVVVDGTSILTNTAVSSSSWASYSANSNLNSGTHSLSISFTNAYAKNRGNSGNSCRRALYLDVTNFYGPVVVTPAPTVALSASPTSVAAGMASTLTWNSTNATDCTASGAWGGLRPTQGSASTGAINQNSTYTLTCAGTGGSASASAVVTASSGSSGHQYFSALSLWNLTIPPTAITLSNSATMVNTMYNTSSSVNVNQGAYTPTVFLAPAGTPRYIAVNQDGWTVDDVPIPAGYHASNDSDAMSTIIDLEKGRAYNFLQLARDSTGAWRFNAGGVFNINGSGWWDGTIGPWSGRAANSALLAGLITPEDVAAGAINHALAVSLKGTANGGHVYPALTNDGGCSSACVPEGSWIQLDPSLTDSQLLAMGVESGELIIMHALQRYGAYDVDSTNDPMVFSAQNTTGPGGASYNYPAAWSNGITKEIIKHFRVLSPPTPSTAYDSRLTYGEPHL